MHQSEDMLLRGITALKAGNKLEAESLLRSFVQQHPQNIDAWLWLGASVSTPDETLYCLERVLALDPDNSRAKAGIRWARSKAKPTPSETMEFPSDFSQVKQEFNLDNQLHKNILETTKLESNEVHSIPDGKTLNESFIVPTAEAASGISESHFFPNLIIAILILTLVLGILIIVALLNAWLGWI